MRNLRLGTALLLASVVATPLAAQKAGTLELGGFGRWTFFDSSLGLANSMGGGARLGLFFLKNLALEAGASYTETDKTSVTGPIGLARGVEYIPITGRLVYHLPVGASNALLIGGGYTRNLWRGQTVFRGNEDAAGALLGLRLRASDLVHFRLEGTADYAWNPLNDRPTSTPAFPQSNNLNFGAQAGVSLLLGNSTDADGDGVRDKMDRCPKTPKGESVDADGCSASQKDSDNDGVMDSADKCPSTPAGEAVDANGCSASQKDSDGDGVRDNRDKCPNTAAGARVNADGCVDSDGDGVLDDRDKCPNTPAGQAVDADGCADSQKDADKDGVIDNRDKCPNTPAGEAVDNFGCGASQRDSDADGVPDSLDRCPNTPSGVTVDDKGCPSFVPGETPLVLEGVNFETAKSTLLDQSQAILDGVAQSLIANPDVRVEVGGHTDSRGADAANMRLSRARAKAVRDYLVNAGVNPNRITSQGYGEKSPIADNDTDEGRARNRRVELKRLP